MGASVDYKNIILLSDMDGTLLNSEGVVSDENKKAICQFVQNGGHFGIATGRSQNNFLSVLKGVPINEACILYNGGGLYHLESKQFLELSELPKERLKVLLNNCLEEYPKVMIQIYKKDACYIVSDKKYANEEIVKKHQPCKFCSLQELWEDSWIKILFYGEFEQLKELEKKIKQSDLIHNVCCVFSDKIFMEILPYGTSKGSMLKKLKDYRGKDYRIYAVGDYNNDLEMLREADIGIAVENALPELKKEADWITVNHNDSAIAKVIYQMMG